MLDFFINYPLSTVGWLAGGIQVLGTCAVNLSR
jgi:hypothetical protein